MSSTEFIQWWTDTAQFLVRQYEQYDSPPKSALTEDKLLAEFHRLCTIDPSSQIVRDYTDNTSAYLNAVRVTVADQFFKNICEAKDHIGSRWISVLDQLRTPKEFLSAITRTLKNDGRFLFSPTVRRTTASLEEYLTAHQTASGFWFYKPENDYTKPRRKIYFAKVGEVRKLISRGILPQVAGKNLVAMKDTEKVFLREYRKSERVFPKLFTILQTTLISAPTNFPSVVARAIYSRYAQPSTPGTEITIWDPSMGFGGRLLGALSLLDRPIHYIGTDPNSLNYFSDGSSRYSNLELVFKGEIVSRRETFRGTYLQCGSEEVHSLPVFQTHRGKIDLVMTSPPYFSAELYHDEPTQSSRKFGTYTEWREDFLARTMSTAAEWLRKDGYLILNVANSGGHTIEEDVCCIAEQLKLRLVAIEKMLLAYSPGAGRKRGGEPTTWNFTMVNGKYRKWEPVYVFKKEQDTRPFKKLGILSQQQSTPNKSEMTSQRSAQDAIEKHLKPASTKEAINQVFRRYKSSRRNPYALFSTRISAGLTDKTLRMCKVNGSVVAACFVSKRKVAGKGYLYAGTTSSVQISTKFKGDLDIDAISLVNESLPAQHALMKELRAINGPAWAECLASDEVVARILDQAGFVSIASKVDALSDVLTTYFKGTVKERQQRTVEADPTELVNHRRLPVGNVKPLVKKIAARLNERRLKFINHNSNYNKDDAWSALTLRGYLPDPAYIHDPEEARRGTSQKDINELKKWEKRYSKRHWSLQNTKLMKQFPEVQELLNRLVPGSSKNRNATFKRVRLMRLKPQGGELTRHTDLTDGTLGLDDGKTIRIHFPIITNPNVILTSWDLRDQPIEKHFLVGECWYLNIRLPHTIVNRGTEDRIHLVVDLIANERIRTMISGEQTPPEDLIGDWTDPNPAPVIEENSGFLVVRDDLLSMGSKVRFLDYLVKTASEKEFVFGASNKVGYGAISLSYLCRKYGKKAIFFMAKTRNPTWHQKKVLELGGIIHFVPNGMLNVTQARARDYAAKDPKRRRLLPIGLEDQTVLASIVKVARSLKYKNKPVVPKEIWSVGSSGTLSRGLQAAFPNAIVHVVQTGHAMSKEQIGRAILHKSPYKFDQKCKEADLPPYNSERYCDSKVWSFVKKHAKKGALIWNVA
nr:aspartyl/asparaginyl beta-hydroxylase domain-containing protein [Nitrosomonas nitrosa]